MIFIDIGDVRYRYRSRHRRGLDRLRLGARAEVIGEHPGRDDEEHQAGNRAAIERDLLDYVAAVTFDDDPPLVEIIG